VGLDSMHGEESEAPPPSGAAEHELGSQQEQLPGAADPLEAPPSGPPEADAQPGMTAKAGAMRTLWLLVRGLFVRPAGPPLAADTKPPPPDHLRACLDLLDAHPGLRSTTIRILGPQATEQGVTFTHEHVETEDEKGNARQTDLYVAYRCSNNHWIDQNVKILGTCFCGAILCSTPGCFAVCAACSACCCSRHRKSHIDDGQVVTYCSRCHWRKFWFG